MGARDDAASRAPPEKNQYLRSSRLYSSAEVEADLRAAGRSIGRRLAKMDVHGLQSHASGTGKAVPHQLSRAGEEAGGKFLDLRLHCDGAVFVDPAAGFDIDLLPGAELQFKHVPE